MFDPIFKGSLGYNYHGYITVPIDLNKKIPNFNLRLSTSACNVIDPLSSINVFASFKHEAVAAELSRLVIV